MAAARVVVIGTGFGQHFVAPVYREMGWEVDIVSPRDGQAVRAAVERPCDLVSIHSPPFMHAEHVRLAAEHRRNMLCDKPFAQDAGEAREMLRLATEAGVLHHVNFEFRRSPLRLRIRELIAEGAIGTPRHSTERSFVSAGRRRHHGWLFEKDLGGWIGALGSHSVDTLRFLFGEVAAVGGQTWIDTKERRDRDRTSDRIHESTAEDAFTAWFRMESGLTATLDTGYAVSTDLGSNWTILGEEGAIEVVNSTELRLVRPGAAPAEAERYPIGERDPHQPAIGLWLRELGQAVLDGRQLKPSFAEGVACDIVLERLRAAAQAAAVEQLQATGAD